MIIQCPACNTSFSVSKDKFGTKIEKLSALNVILFGQQTRKVKLLKFLPL